MMKLPRLRLRTGSSYTHNPPPPPYAISHQSSPIGLKSVTRARNPSYIHYSHRHVRYVTHPLSAYTAPPMPINRWLRSSCLFRAASEAPPSDPPAI
ncbi:hypothetical protein BKA56DRAFT_565540, partial [Ilyonectria sp. MPI-CAGE-AT-0026]